jgi:formylglycine-generating enzyme required for sulfatase activity
MDITALLPPFVHIPSTAFLMGTPESELSGLAQRYGGTRESYREESPQHTLTVPAFALARVPVTNALYSAFVASTDRRPPLHWRGQQPPVAIADHPVVDVTWVDAQAFCAWLSTVVTDSVPVTVSASGTNNSEPPPFVALPKFRLPTEAEWEHAARGSDGRTFPWGDEFDEHRANTKESGIAATSSVGSYPAGASPYGVLNMAGNVWELTATLDALYPYNAADGREELTAEGRRIARGGCYANPQGFARCACRFRFPPTLANQFLGFRLALSYT